FARAILVGLPTAQAADTVLTLACQGTVTIKRNGGRLSEYEPDAISMGPIVKFTARTVQGTARWGPYLFDDQLPITELNEGTDVSEVASANRCPRSRHGGPEPRARPRPRHNKLDVACHCSIRVQ